MCAAHNKKENSIYEIKIKGLDFPSGLVVKNLPANAEHSG